MTLDVWQWSLEFERIKKYLKIVDLKSDFLPLKIPMICQKALVPGGNTKKIAHWILENGDL